VRSGCALWAGVSTHLRKFPRHARFLRTPASRPPS
jgi:hypothetical protein